ncbi:hypothetical protein AFE02nite_31100 [Actinotalea fermentans]|uniref:Secreted protein n=1 Tax=Actinotalea fermentans TaxID=43671 RepID=A0A511Z1W8_9CELL|nr:hypothetical protein AFE02nite_31100 [Actinotalea fermentans]
MTVLVTVPVTVLVTVLAVTAAARHEPHHAEHAERAGQQEPPADRLLPAGAEHDEEDGDGGAPDEHVPAVGTQVVVHRGPFVAEPRPSSSSRMRR